ncbi:DUF481 domain-containing protein [Desulfobacterales bacterium HSG2]|nr:DUF481 domain-containing protein [Desulfobacterales bacterium HSG2]
MRRFFKYPLFFFLCVIIVVPAWAQTSDQSAPTETNDSESETQKKKDQDLGRWWKRSPLSYDPIPSQFLYHFEASYFYSQSEGNFNKDNHLINTGITLRKQRFTNILSYSFDKRNSSRPISTSVTVNEDGSVSIGEATLDLRYSKSHNLSNHLLYALTKRFYLGAGIEWVRDDLQDIENRYIYFFGPGCRVINTSEFSLTLFGAYGYEELEYTDAYNDLMGGLALKYNVLDELDTGVSRSDNAYFAMNTRWQATDSLEFFQDAGIVINLEKQENRYIWRWELSIGANYKIYKYLYLTAKFEEEYNKDPAIGVRKRDQATNIGIKLVF